MLGAPVYREASASATPSERFGIADLGGMIDRDRISGYAPSPACALVKARSSTTDSFRVLV